MNDCILLETGNGVATLTLNRPAVLNAFDPDMAELLNARVTEIARDRSLRAVLINATGPFFSAGGDIDFFRRAGTSVAETQDGLTRLIDNVHAAIECIANLETPVVAAVQGGAAGFGLSLLAACDLVVANRDARFSMAYMNLGATPDGGATWFLPRLLGLRKARQLAMLSDRVSGDDALRLGLVDFLTDPATLAFDAQALVARLATGPTHAQGRLKALLTMTFQRTLQQQLAAEKESFLDCATTTDFREGLAAFSERRAPRFTGQ